MSFVVLVIGAPGAGRTTARKAVAAALAEADVRHASFEVEALALSHPPLLSDAVFDHARALAAAYRARGFDLLVVTATVESQWWCEALLDALGAPERLLVRLEASDAELERRLRARAPDGAPDVESRVRASAPLAATARKIEADLVVDTETTPPGEIARRTLTALEQVFGFVPPQRGQT